MSDLVPDKALLRKALSNNTYFRKLISSIAVKKALVIDATLDKKLNPGSRSTTTYWVTVASYGEGAFEVMLSEVVETNDLRIALGLRQPLDLAPDMYRVELHIGNKTPIIRGMVDIDDRTDLLTLKLSRSLVW